MQFFEPRPWYVWNRQLTKNAGLPFKTEADTWYREVLLEGRDCTGRSPSLLGQHTGNAIITLANEHTWYAIGKPYYKVFPAMATMMSEISIDIPPTELKLPYPAFFINLADDPQNDFCENGLKLKWILVGEVGVDSLPGGAFRCHIDAAGPKLKLLSGANRAISIDYEFEGADSKNFPNRMHYLMSLNHEKTVEDYFQASYEGTKDNYQGEIGDYIPSKEMIHRIVRLAVATCFFGLDRHEVVLPDLPRRQIERRIAKEGKAALRNLKGERLNEKHWTIGREISLPRPEVVENEQQGEVGGKRRWQHATIRRGHMRWQRTGAGREQRKLTFVHPHFCRPDLPFAEAHGFRIPDPK